MVSPKKTRRYSVVFGSRKHLYPPDSKIPVSEEVPQKPHSFDPSGHWLLENPVLPGQMQELPDTLPWRRIRRNRDENAASPFICRVVELEQEKLEVQRKNAGLIVGKDGRVYEP